MPQRPRALQFRVDLGLNFTDDGKAADDVRLPASLPFGAKRPREFSLMTVTGAPVLSPWADRMLARLITP
jgi:hypothetical protein